jgi:thiol-disulfide isomerase/thioredoxin
MKRLIIIPVFIFISISVCSQQNVEIYTFNVLQNILNKKNDTVYVVNFWATWCKPCVKELPYFEKLNKEYSEKVKVLLVSLDFEDQLETRLIPFLNQRNIESEVILLNESNPNDYIDKVSTEWSGAIPATIIFNKNGSDFYEQSFEYEELVSAVELKLN